MELPEAEEDGAQVAVTLEVFNALGVRCPVRINPTVDNVLALDLSDFGNGMYLINIIGEGHVETRRVVIE